MQVSNRLNGVVTSFAGLLLMVQVASAQCGDTAANYQAYAEAHGWAKYNTGGFFDGYIEQRGPNDDPDGDGLVNEDEFKGWTGTINGGPIPEGYSYQVGVGTTTCGPSFTDADSDNDGLSDWGEKEAGTNPHSGDTDGDGMGDAWEVYVGLDPCDNGSVNPLNDPDEDPDGDGISNLDEMKTIIDSGTFIWGESPGATKHINVIEFTNSACPYTFPLNYDSDGDGLVDSYEHRQCLHNNLTANISDDRKADYDLDGLSNFREQCVHPLLAMFWSNGDIPSTAEADLDSAVLGMDWSRSSSGLTHAPSRKGLIAPGYLNKAEYDGYGNASPAGLGVPYDLGPGGVKWGKPYTTRRWTACDSPDTDSDLLPDGWELEHGLNPLKGKELAKYGYAEPSGPLGDPDGDGKLNLEEYYGQDGYRLNYVTGTGDETDPWITRVVNGTHDDTFQAAVGQWSYTFKNGQGPEQYIGLYDASYKASFSPTAAYGLLGFFDPEKLDSGTYYPIPGVPPACIMDDRLDGTFSRFDPFATTMSGIVFRDAPGQDDGQFTAGVDDAWLDQNGDGIFEFADDIIIVDNTGLSGGEQMTALITANVPQKWPENGLDTDDDGYPDQLEIQKDPAKQKYPTSAVNPLSPFEPKSIAIRTGAGIEISPTNRNVIVDPSNEQLGTGPNRRFFSRDFTVETWVYLDGTGGTDFQGSFIRGCVRIGGLYNLDGYNLGVDRYVNEGQTTNYAVPYISYQTAGGKTYAVTAERTIPMNRWVHLAGVYSHDRNAMSLYIDGLLEQSGQVLEESSSSWGITAGGTVFLAQDRVGAVRSFADQLWMDEVRIWGIPRASDDVANDRTHLINPFQEPGYDRYSQYYTVSAYSNYTYDLEAQVVTNYIDTNMVDFVLATNYVTVTNLHINFETNHPINALFCYYPFDDGGRTAQDMTERAASSLDGYSFPADNDLAAAPKDDLFYGDDLYTIEPYHVTASGTNVLFEFDNTRKAPVIGMLDPEQGAIDSDGDQLPDGWEVIMEFNPYRKKTPDHTVLDGYDPMWASRTGAVYDSETDPDGDGLSTIYEYWARTNPRQDDTDQNGVLDINEDFDADGLKNLLEVELQSRPDLADTDDDQFADGIEQADSTKPNDALSPIRSISAVFDGSEGSYLDIPGRADMRLKNFSIEARVLPSVALTNLLADGDGATLLRKVDQITDNNLMAANYDLRIVRKGSYFTPEIRYISVDPAGNGTINSLAGNPAVQALDRMSLDMFQNLGGSFVDLAASYDYTNGLLALYMDGRLVGSKAVATNRPPLTGQGPQSFIRMGERYAGAMDYVRVWDRTLSASELEANRTVQYNGTTSNLVANFRFDDGGFPLHAIYEKADELRAAPPAVPVAGSRYLVDSGASGVWSGKDGQIAEYDGMAWSYVTPKDGGQISLADGSWYTYRSAIASWTLLSAIIPSARYAAAPASPEPGDSWLQGSFIVTYASGVMNTSPVAVARAFSQGHMQLGTAETGDFAYDAQYGEMVRCSDGATDSWKRWGNNVQWLGNAMTAVQQSYATEAALLSDRSADDTFAGDAYLVQGPTPYVYSYTASGDPNQAASYTKKPVYTGSRVLDMNSGTVLDYTGAAFETIADAATDGGGLYLQINSEGTTYRSDGSSWARWGFVPTFQEFTVTNGWMTQWSKSAQVYGNVKAGTAGKSNSSGGGGVTPSDGTDSDNDGLPDEWEMQYFGNLEQGPTGDPDGDGLQNLYEYLAGTNPTIKYSNGESSLNDYLFDSDGDGLGNGQEQQYMTNPGVMDSDDDGVKDYTELEAILSYPHTGNWEPPRSPLYSMGSYDATNYSFHIDCSGFPADGVSIPDGPTDNPSGSMTDWTIETWYYSENVGAQQGVLIGKYANGLCAFALGVEGDRPYVKFDYQVGISTNTVKVQADSGTINGATWTHLAGSWNSSERTLSLYVDGTILYREQFSEESWEPVNDAGVVSLAIGEGSGFSGKVYMDNVRIWNVARSLRDNDASRRLLLDIAGVSGLMRCFRFDDGGSTVEDFAHPLNTVASDVNWNYVLNPASYGIKVGASGQIAWLNGSQVPSPLYNEELVEGEYIPSWWLSVYQVTNSNNDVDGDGLSNLYEFMGKTDPTKKNSYGGTVDSQRPGTPTNLTLIQEQTYFSDPRYDDTDGDGMNDDEEIFGSPKRDQMNWPVSDPALALQNGDVPANPQANRYSVQTGAGQYLTLRDNGTPGKYALADWTIEAWVFPQAVQDGTIICREVQVTNELVNYALGVEANSMELWPVVMYKGANSEGTPQAATTVGGTNDADAFGEYNIPTGVWSHVAGRYNSSSKVLTLFVNGRPVADNVRVAAVNKPHSPIGGKTVADLRIGEDFAGLVDEVKIWAAAQDDSALYSSFRSTGSGSFGGYDIGENGAPTNAVITHITSIADAQAEGVRIATNGQLLVKFKPSVMAGTRLQVLSLLGIQEKKRFEFIGVDLVAVTNAADMQDALDALNDNELVEYAEPDLLGELTRTPNDTLFAQQWALNNTTMPSADISAIEAWDKSIGSRDVIVAVMDSGVQYDHEDLAANMWVNENETPNNGIDDDGNGYVDDYYGYDFFMGDSDPMDAGSHGTHVSGIIGAVGNNGLGVAGANWNVRIMALKCGSADLIYYSAVIEAMEYALNEGAKISNHSWGGFGASQALYDAMKVAGEQGHLIVAAAGNYGIDIDDFVLPFVPAGFDLDNIISVGSSDDADAMSSFSNYGKDSVDLFAPGSSILSTVPTNAYATKSGTSMASPMVAGVAALIRSMNPQMGYADVKAGILNGTDAVAAFSDNCVSGGRLNAATALSGMGGLVAYFRMDDGGMAGAQDMAVVNDNVFDWRSVAVLTGGATYNGDYYAQMTGDSDSDTMPDWFETAYRVVDPDADEDGDGLHNLYEYYAGTNPRQIDTDGNGFSDDQEDSDGDALANGTEQVIGSDAGLADTDDDGIPDGVEVAEYSSPILSVYPTNNLALRLNGGEDDAVVLPDQPRFALSGDWTIEGWVRPDLTETNGCVLLGRSVGGWPMGVNYSLALNMRGSHLYAMAGIADLDGNRKVISQPTNSLPIAFESWTHLAATFDKDNSEFCLYVNGECVAKENSTYVAPVSDQAGVLQNPHGG